MVGVDISVPVLVEEAWLMVGVDINVPVLVEGA